MEPKVALRCRELALLKDYSNKTGIPIDRCVSDALFPNVSCAADYPELRRSWHQTLLLGQAGTDHIHPWYKKGKGGNSLSGCSRFFRATSWRLTCVLVVNRRSLS